MDKQFELLYTIIQFYYYEQITLECVEFLTGLVRENKLYAVDQLLLYSFNLYSETGKRVELFKLYSELHKKGILI